MPIPFQLLCEETGKLAQEGTCPVHGGDACLAVYGLQADLLAAREALALALADAIEEIESRFPSDKNEREALAARLRQVIRDSG